MTRPPAKTAAQDSETLNAALLDAQFELQENRRRAVLVVIAGADGAGKGAVANRLYDRLDAHHVETLYYGDPTDDERGRPQFWRYWRDMPARGKIGLVLGGWHHAPLHARATDENSRVEFEAALADINRFEEMLTLEGVALLKIWLTADEKKARKRLAALREADGALRRPVVLEWEAVDTKKERRRLIEAGLEMARTSVGAAPWLVVPADDADARDAAVARALLELLRRLNDEPAPARPEKPPRPDKPAKLAKPGTARTGRAAGLDLTLKADPATYDDELDELQDRLTEAATSRRFRKSGLVLVFEGPDAAGKGGAIRRVRAALDPRQFRVHGVSAPTDEEKARPYLWRFWRNIPRRGHIGIFDRSWYGRVLVERVEGFATEAEWRRAYGEIVDFERQIAQADYAIVKFWLAISPQEQLRRFNARETIASKRYKITPDDWRNRDKWAAYDAAMTDMVERTSTAFAPWTLVEAEDKKYARLKVLRTIVERLETSG
jgi:polyphosphate:AMP phosphotransferase